MRKVVTRYETMIRHDEAGRFKGGHHIDITRYLPDDGETADDMPPPRISDALPLTVEDLAPLLAEDAASALAQFSEVKGAELAARAALQAAQGYITQIEAEIRQRDDVIAALTAERDALNALLAPIA